MNERSESEESGQPGAPEAAGGEAGRASLTSIGAGAHASARLSRQDLIGATMLGLDHGLRRIGVALKPAGQDWALPIRVLEIKDEREAIRAVRALIEEYRPAAIVLGLPENADPAQAHAVRRFARKAREGVSGVRWLFADERNTSQEAESLAREATLDMSRRGARQAPSDDLAAKLILERYLAARA